MSEPAASATSVEALNSDCIVTALSNKGDPASKDSSSLAGKPSALRMRAPAGKDESEYTRGVTPLGGEYTSNCDWTIYPRWRRIQSVLFRRKRSQTATRSKTKMSAAMEPAAAIAPAEIPLRAGGSGGNIAVPVGAGLDWLEVGWLELVSWLRAVLTFAV